MLSCVSQKISVGQRLRKAVLSLLAFIPIVLLKIDSSYYFRITYSPRKIKRRYLEVKTLKML